MIVKNNTLTFSKLMLTQRFRLNDIKTMSNVMTLCIKPDVDFVVSLSHFLFYFK